MRKYFTKRLIYPLYFRKFVLIQDIFILPEVFSHHTQVSLLPPLRLLRLLLRILINSRSSIQRRLPCSSEFLKAKRFPRDLSRLLATSPAWTSPSSPSGPPTSGTGRCRRGLRRCPALPSGPTLSLKFFKTLKALPTAQTQINKGFI